MFKINSISKTKIFLFITILLGCFPILSFGMRSIVTIIWSILGIYIFYTKKNRCKLDTDILIFISPYLLIFLSLFYSTNVDYGLNTLVKMLSFIIFPLIFYLNRDFFTKKQIYQILDFFSLSVLILVSYQLLQIIFHYDVFNSSLTLEEIKANGFTNILEIGNEKIAQIKLRRFRNFIIKISNTHTTYQGLWICLTIFYSGLRFLKSTKYLSKIINIIIIIVLLLWFNLISARMPFLAFIIALTLVLILFYKVSVSKKILMILLPSFLLTVLFLFNNPFSTRVKEYYKTGFSFLNNTSNSSQFNSSNVRNGIYFCDLKLIKKHPFIGVGLGDVQDELNNCYNESIGADIYEWHSYNSHNQYAFFWISSGILGLLSILSLLVLCFYKAFNNKNYLLFFVTCIISLVFFTENLLERSDGLFFSCFFMSILYFNRLKK